MWTLTPAGGSAYVILDDTIAKVYKIPTPEHAGFRLVARKHFAGSFPTDLLTYRRVS
jgi:hypothetical protein